MSRRSPEGAFAARAARARKLTAGASATADLLTFYAGLAEYQQRLVDQWNGAIDGPAPAGSLLGAVDAGLVGCAARDLVHWLVRLKPDTTHAPEASTAYDAMRDVTVEEWRECFDAFRASPEDAADHIGEVAVFVLEAVLQPIAEGLAAGRMPARDRADRAPHAHCPVCGGAPVVGVLREEGHGARRRLVCGLCFTEWDYLRLMCVKCGEQRFEALPVFSAEQFPHARIDACDTCRRYLKTIDATRDGHAIPVVDDLATLALDLWAREQGYVRVRANLVGI